MLGAVRFLRGLARFILIVSISGAIPPSFAQAGGADTRQLAGTRVPEAVNPVRATRPVEGGSLLRDGLRLDRASRSNHASPGLSSPIGELTPPAVTDAVLRQDLAAGHFIST